MRISWYCLSHPVVGLAIVLASYSSVFGQYAWAQNSEKKQPVPGVTKTEIKIGQTMPYSGPVSAYGTIGKVEAAYFRKINEQGGINGRKINLISLDDGYSPPKTVEQTRRLIEQEEVFALFQAMGTAPNAAILKYTNSKKVPHLFASTGAEKMGDPKNYPWTMPWNPPFVLEGKIYAKWLLKARPDAKVAILYQNDDLGKEYVKGFKAGLGEQAARVIIAEASYETTDPTIDSQVITLKGSGASTLFNAATPKFAAQAIRKTYDIGWRPLYILSSTSASIPAVLKPAGLEKSTGIVSAGYLKGDPVQWKDDPAVQEYVAFMKKYYPEGDVNDVANAFGYAIAMAFAEVLKRCGNELTRDNLMAQAASLNNVANAMLFPGITLSTSASDYHPIEQMQMMRFDGAHWVLFGDLLGK